MMALKCKGCVLLWIGVVLGFIMLTFYSGITSGEGFLGERADFPSYYPEKFNGIGRIDRIARDEIVISDSLYKLSPYAKYATPKRKTVQRTSLGIGNLVGFVTNEKNEITSLWVIE